MPPAATLWDTGIDTAGVLLCPPLIVASIWEKMVRTPLNTLRIEALSSVAAFVPVGNVNASTSAMTAIL